MTDLEGNELKVGVVYIIPDTNTNRLVIAKFSHETEASYMFYPVKPSIVRRNGNSFYSWTRRVAKDTRFDTISVIPVSQAFIDKYNIV